MAGMIPPLDIRVPIEGNAAQGCCCSTFDDDAHVVFDHRSKKFESKEKKITVCSDVRCCVWGESPEDRAARKNRATQQEIDSRLKHCCGVSLATVKDELQLDFEDTDPISAETYNNIREYAIRLVQTPRGDIATMETMSVPTFVPHEKKEVSLEDRQPGPLAVHVSKKKSNPPVRSITNWGQLEGSKQVSREESRMATSRLLSGIPNLYNSDSESLPANEIMAKLRLQLDQEIVQLQKERERAEEVQKIADAFVKALSSQGCQKISPREIRERIGGLYDELLKDFSNDEEELEVARVLSHLKTQRNLAQEEVKKCQKQEAAMHKLGRCVSESLSPMRESLNQAEVARIISSSLDDAEGASTPLPESPNDEIEIV